jgi:hypothetical protein
VNNHDSTNNQFENTTNVDGGEVNNFYEDYDYSNTSYGFGGASFGNGVNGTVSGSSMMFVAHIEFTAKDLFPNYEEEDYRNNSFNYSYTYYDYLTNDYRTDDFEFNCSVFYLIGSLSNGSTFQVSYWEDNNNYWNAWDNEFNSTIADLLNQAGGTPEIRSTCDESYAASMPIEDGTSGYHYNFLSIDIPQGYAIEYLQLTSTHDFYGCYYWLNHSQCTDAQNHEQHSIGQFYSFSEGVSPGYPNWYYGGWENITIDFDIRFQVCDNNEECGTSYIGFGYGYYSIWPTSEYEMTLYYRFVLVAPVE